ncbi:MAG TPA: histidine phosphatase family protein [Phycisphaerae bacterium]|nr:histidine phosphatase family protein [Phycisphaerae bacterium]
MLVYLVRHAHSLANAGEDEGLNSGLSPLGMRQVDALTRRFADTQFTAVYSSPFRRCLETALPIAALHLEPVRLRQEIFEFHGLTSVSGIESGLPGVEELVGHHPGRVVACPDCDGPIYWPALDEPFEAMVARAQAFAAYLKGRWRGEKDKVLVVGHGSPIARLIEAWLTDRPGPAFQFVIDNATVHLLRFRGGVSSLLQLNDTSHLTGLIAPESPFGPTTGAPEMKGAEW